MSVRKRKDTRTWMIHIRWQPPDGSRRQTIRRISPIQTRRGAEHFERQVRLELINGDYGKEKSRLTLEEFHKDFLNVYAKNNNKPSAQQTKRGALKNHLLPYFGKMYLDEITTLDVERYKAKKLGEKLQKRKKKPDGTYDEDATYCKKTINNHLGVLSKMLNVAVDWKFLEYRIKIPMFRKVLLPEIDFLNFEELNRLLEKAEGQHGRTIEVAAKTGLRIGELRGLHWEDVDLVAKKLTVRRAITHGKIDTPKSGKPREVPLCDSVIKVFKKQKHLRGDFVFSQPDGEPLEINTMYRRLDHFRERAGLRKIGFHTFRHTFASHLVMRGIPLKAVQEFLGHATIDMTLRYSHLSPEVKLEYVQVLDNQEHYMGTSENERNSIAKTGKPTLVVTN